MRPGEVTSTSALHAEQLQVLGSSPAKSVNVVLSTSQSMTFRICSIRVKASRQLATAVPQHPQPGLVNVPIIGTPRQSRS
jgi:hypothetical protein